VKKIIINVFDFQQDMMAIQDLEKNSKELKKQITWASIEEQENVNI